MKYLKEAYKIFGGMAGPTSFYQFCADCDEEITGLDPMFFDADGDMDADGHMRDCSTYLCEPCGQARGYTVGEDR